MTGAQHGRPEERLGSYSIRPLLARVWPLAAGRRLALALLGLLSLAMAGIELWLPLLVRQAIDGFIAVPVHGPEDRAAVLALAGWYLGLTLVYFVLAYLTAYGLAAIGQEIVARLRARVYAHLLRQPVRTFDEQPLGRLVTRVVNDPANLAELFSSVLAAAPSDVLLFAGALGFLVWLDWRTALVLLALAPCMLALSAWFNRASARLGRELRVSVARLATIVTEAIGGLSVVRAFAAEAASERRLLAAGREYFDLQLRLTHVAAIFRPMIEVLATTAMALLLWYGGLRVLAGQLSFGTLVAFLLYLHMLFRPLQSLADKFGILQAALTSSERVLRLLDLPGEGQRPDATITGERRGPPPDDRAMARASPQVAAPLLELDRVTFGYHPGRPVLHDVSLRVCSGERVALVGPTGSGKSTVLSLLLGFYQVPDGQGAVRVAGRPVAAWSLPELRRRFALVPQDVFLFAGSVRDNVVLFEQGQGDEQRLAEALTGSRLSEVLARLPGGLAHALNERGQVLSQGERQLVSVARALYEGGPILALDEATSAVDSLTEQRLQAALAALMADRTALIVAHRLSTVQAADAIIVLDAGRIVERGTHAELLAADGLYARLYRTQLRGALLATGDQATPPGALDEQPTVDDYCRRPAT